MKKYILLKNCRYDDTCESIRILNIPALKEEWKSDTYMSDFSEGVILEETIHQACYIHIWICTLTGF